MYTTREQGLFSVVLPLEKKQLLWYTMWVTACVLRFFELITLGYVGFSSMRLLKTQKTQAMEEQAIEDMGLESRLDGLVIVKCLLQQ